MLRSNKQVFFEGHQTANMQYGMTGFHQSFNQANSIRNKFTAGSGMPPYLQNSDDATSFSLNMS